MNYVSRVTTGGWVLFVVLLLGCFPLCWIPFIAMREKGSRCPQCSSLVGALH